jgi:WD40 repeat protein/serine/threonine protein kinase
MARPWHDSGQPVPQSGEIDKTIDASPRADHDAPPIDADRAEIPATNGADYPELVAIDRRHYELGAEIAKGGMGRVVAARDLRLGRAVAIKELLPRHRDSSRRFEQEARITARLQHPAIIHVYEAGVWSGGEPFYAMPQIAGRSLDKVIAERPLLADRLGLLPNVIAVVDALAYAHSHRVIHRDLKPSNVLVGEFGETVVIDWGLAKDLAAPDDAAASLTSMRSLAGESLAGAPTLGSVVGSLQHSRAPDTAAGSIVGTPAYMPPEQARGEPVDERADVYALGALLYHVLVAAAPYVGASSRAVLSAVVDGPPPDIRDREPGAPVDLIAIVGKAMARDPRRRYANAGELVLDLKRFQTGQLVAARRYTARERAVRWLRRHRTAVALTAIAVAGLAVIGAISVRRILSEKAVAERATRRLLVENGRAELLVGHAGRAVVSLARAYELGERGAAIGFLLAEAMRPFRMATHTFAAGDGAIAVARSADGRRVATGSEDGKLLIWDVATGAAVMLATDRPIRFVAFDPRGRHLIAGGDATLAVWDVERRAVVATMAGHTDAIVDIEVDRAGERVATGSRDGTARVWDLATGEILATFEHGARVNSIHFSPDGEYVLTASDDRTAGFWDAVTGDVVQYLRAHDGPVLSARFDAAGALVITAGEDATARLWNPRTGKQVLARPLDHRGAVLDARLSPDGRRAITASRDHTAALWEIPPVSLADTAELPRVVAELVRRLEHADEVEAVAFSSDARQFVTSGRERIVRLWDGITGQALATYEGHADQLAGVLWSDDDTTLLSAGFDGTARVWSAPRPALRPSSDAGALRGVAIAGNTVVAGAADGVVVWSRDRGEQLAFVDDPVRVAAVAMSPDGDRVAIASEDGSAAIWDVATRATVAVLDHETAPVYAIAWRSDGAAVITGARDGVRVWSTSTWQVTNRFAGERQINAIALDPGETHLVTASESGEVAVWSTATWSSIAAFRIAGGAYTVAFGPAGDRVVVGGDGDTPEIWTLAPVPRKLVVLEGPTGIVHATGFSPDGALVITGSADGVTRVWDATTGKLLGRLAGHADAVTGMAFDRDRTHLWTASADGAVRMWDVAPVAPTVGELRAFVVERVPWRKLADDAPAIRLDGAEMKGGSRGERRPDGQ